MNETSMIEERLVLKSDDEAVRFLSDNESVLKCAERLFDVKCFSRDMSVRTRGEAQSVENAYRFLKHGLSAVRQGRDIVSFLASESEEVMPVAGESTFSEFRTYKGKTIRATTDGQQSYLETVSTHDITVCIGPAGTGKTFLAVMCAVKLFKAGHVSRIILTRPVVEAGEHLGFLPGDITAKIDPYLRPLYDAMYELLGFEEVAKLIGKGIIEIAPLAFMRGRTLNDACIILDEAQNTTPAQMKMFLTRLGEDSQCVVTGDVTQVDLPHKEISGLVQVQKILKGVQGIGFVALTEKDVVRHRLVKDIIHAYEKKADRKK